MHQINHYENILSKRLQNQQYVGKLLFCQHIWYTYSGYLETEFQMIYSKIPITSYQKGQQRRLF